MESFKVELIDDTEVVRTLTVAAESHVHAVMKTVPRPLKPGRKPGMPWIRVTDASSKSHEFHVAEQVLDR